MKKIGIIVFVVALSLGIITASIFSFGKFSMNLFSMTTGIEGSGLSKTEKRDVAEFSSIEVEGVFQVEVTLQKDFDVQVEADDNLLEFIKTEVDGQTLKIETTKRLNLKNPLIVRISAPNIVGVGTSGVAQVTLTNINNDQLEIDSSGASRIKADGVTKSLIIDLSGASQFEADGLRSETARVEASGASRADIFVSNDLTAEVSGASKVYYSGNPKDLTKKTSGASCIREK